LKRISIALLSILTLFSSLHLSASVDYIEWEDQSITKIIESARAQNKMILVVITQPDWCPPCIRMDNAIINNSTETEFSGLAKEWINLEVLGYDKAGAEFLKQQNIRFHGTPTTMLLDPSRIINPSKSKKAKLTTNGLQLGDLKVVHSLASFPDDFTAQFQRAVNGYDLVSQAQAEMRAEQSVESYEKLAAAYTDQGDVKQANRVYSSLFFRTDLSIEKRQELEWKKISDVTQRVAKDHQLTLKQINEFVESYPDFIKDVENYEDYAYKKAWSLLAVGKSNEAQALMRKAYVEPNDVANIRTYLYFAFRNPVEELVKDAYSVNEQAIKDFPESEAALQSSRGRLLRRLNRLEEAKQAFERAIALLPDDEESRESLEVYQGQLKYVTSEISKNKI